MLDWDERSLRACSVHGGRGLSLHQVGGAWQRTFVVW